MPASNISTNQHTEPCAWEIQIQLNITMTKKESDRYTPLRNNDAAFPPWRSTGGDGRETMRRTLTLPRTMVKLHVVLLLCLSSLSLVLATSPPVQPSAEASSAAHRPHHRPRRPPFLAHVDDAQLREAAAWAERRHEAAVARALSHFPTDRPAGPAASAVPDLPVRTYRIQAPGALPDFADDLPRCVHVVGDGAQAEAEDGPPPRRLLSPAECARVVRMAEDHFAASPDDGGGSGGWPRQRSGQYGVAGFYLESVPAVRDWFTAACRDRLLPLLQRTFPEFVGPDATALCVDHAYLFKYTPETGQRTDVHTDSGALSFTIALNDECDYTGGGTWFEGLQGEDDATANDVQDGGVLSMPGAGQVTVRPGGVKHCGHAVESGTRYVIGGFCLHRRRAELVRQLLAADGAEDDVANPDARLRALEAAAVLNPECDAVYNLLANEHDRRGEKNKARNVLEYCLEHVHPSSGECAYTLASLYMEQQLPAKAKQCLEICLVCDPYDVDALCAMGQACSALGDRQHEEACYRTLIRIPNAKPTALSTAYCNLGVLAEGTDVEVDFYLKALEALPSAFPPRYSLASCYASRGNWVRACEEFRTAVSNADTEENATKTLRALYQAAGNWIRTEQKDAASLSRDALIERFQAIMGIENYNRLAGIR